MQSSVSKTIEKNFNSCPFKLNIPKIDVLKSKLRLSIPIIFDRQCTDGIVLKCVEIRERNLKPILFEFDNYFIEVQVDDYLIEVELNKSISRNALNNSLINLIFLTSKGKKIKVEYKINKELVLHFEHVEIVEEKLENIITFNSVQKNKNLHSKDSILENGFSKLTLNEYKKKIYQEMCYLKDAGGRKYRATNGEYIEKMHNMYAYSFELESELYLSDDAPITIIISDVNIKGTVLMCEGFQIIILSERDLGKNVSLAFITVDPWKLLQALYKKLDLLTSKDKLAVKILTNDSPIEILKSIEDIPMGQEKAIQKALSEDITVIWGPPGTGKTYTMAQIAMNFLSQGKSVLMVSQSNISVDGLINELVEQINKINSELNGKFLKNGKILRYGYVREKNYQ